MDATVQIQGLTLFGETKPRHQGYCELRAQALSNAVVSVGDKTPEPLRVQAHAFKDQVTQVGHAYIKAAREDMRESIAQELERLGFKDAAQATRGVTCR